MLSSLVHFPYGLAINRVHPSYPVIREALELCQPAYPELQSCWVLGRIFDKVGILYPAMMEERVDGTRRATIIQPRRDFTSIEVLATMYGQDGACATAHSLRGDDSSGGILAAVSRKTALEDARRSRSEIGFPGVALAPIAAPKRERRKH